MCSFNGSFNAMRSTEEIHRHRHQGLNEKESQEKIEKILFIKVGCCFKQRIATCFAVIRKTHICSNKITTRMTTSTREKNQMEKSLLLFSIQIKMQFGMQIFYAWRTAVCCCAGTQNQFYASNILYNSICIEERGMNAICLLITIFFSLHVSSARPAPTRDCVPSNQTNSIMLLVRIIGVVVCFKSVFVIFI